MKNVKILSFLFMMIFLIGFSSCKKENSCENCNNEEINSSPEKGGYYCSYPFGGELLANTNGIPNGTQYNLSAEQNTPKKWRIRSTTSGGDTYRKFSFTVTNNHNSQPIIVRAIGVHANLFSESYERLEGCYSVNAGSYKEIRFDDVEPLYIENNSWYQPLYSKDFDYVDWEIIIIGQTTTTVPVEIWLKSWFLTEP